LTLLFSVLAFAATEQWALSISQCAILSLGVYCSLQRRLCWSLVALLPAGVAALGLFQLAAGISVYRFATANAIVNWAVYATLFIVAVQVFGDPEIRRKFLQATLYTGSAIAVLSTAQHFTSEGSIYWIFPVRSGRPFGPFVNPDHYAAFIELILPLAIHAALRDRARAWMHAAIAGVLYGSVIASASRAGAAVVTIEILLLPLLVRRFEVAVKTMGAAALCAGLATAVVGGDTIWKRFHDSDPFRYRREIAASTLQMIARRPWTGFGLGAYATVYPEFATFDSGSLVDHAHNDWAEWTAEGGIPILLLMTTLAVASFPRALRRIWPLGIHALFLHSLVDFPMQIPALGFLLFTFLGILYANSDGHD